MDTMTCDLCGSELVGTDSYDVSLTMTTFDQEGEVQDTMDDPDEVFTGQIRTNYVVSCRMCRADVIEAWNSFLRDLNLDV